MRFITLSALFMLLVSVVACGSTAQPSNIDKAEQINCTTAYRSSSGTRIEAEQTVQLGPNDGEQQITYDALTFTARYAGGELDNERAVQIQVTQPDTTAPLLNVLFQLPQESGPVNQFVGGHGFSGLHYVTDPATGAELQWWCEAAP